MDALRTLRLLESIRLLKMADRVGSHQASTSELFGLVTETPQSERTPFHPRSECGVAKPYAYWITVNYRESYGMYACKGILFNQPRVPPPRRDVRHAQDRLRPGAGLQQARPAPPPRQPARPA